MTRKFLTPKERKYLCENYPHKTTSLVAEKLGCSIGSTYRFAKSLGLKKTPEYFINNPAGRLTKGDQKGASSRFQKGHEPANKGLRRPGYSPGKMASTQFKPGVRQGVAVDLYKPVGTRRISKDGYHEIKINDDMPLQKRWRFVHLVLWEEHLGPLPKGFCVTFKNGDKNDIRIDNLALISRAERMRRNSYHTNYPKEICQVIQLRGAVIAAINRRNRRNEEQNHRSA